MTKPTGLFTLRVDITDMDFACARILVYKDNCARMHGHNFQVAVELEGEVNDDCFIADLGEVEPMLRGMCAKLNNYLLVPAQNPHLQIEHVGPDITIRFRDRQYVLPERDVLLLDLPNTSVEMLSYYFCNELHRKLTEAGYTNLAAISAEIQETPGQGATYRKLIAHEAN